MDYINHLLAFSSKIISLELDKTSVNKIIWLQETYCQEDYLDPYCDSFQVNLIKAKDSMLARIIDNFDEAIKSKCGNDIDLSEYSGKEDWDYFFKTDNEQGSISKRYYDIKLTPKDEKVFKKLWLRRYITVLSEIVSNIRTVTNNPKQVGIDKSKNDVTVVKKVRENKRITIRDKKVYDLVKALNLEIDFLRDDCSAEEFVQVLVGQSDKNIHLNIDNGSFHYLITKLNEYFYNLIMSNVARTDKICSSKGTILKIKNLHNSKSDNPKLKVEIDRFFKNSQ
ncbi:hypothetical protein N9R15_00715 [Flavobacteriaceae bacterium]|nr:hypothetical protein [Flavobacteriaceae bacterium]